MASNLGWTVEDTIDDYAVVLRTAAQADKRDFRYFVDF